MTEIVRAAAYTRVSTDRQAREGLSLDEQQRQVEAYIAAQGWQHAGTFIESGVSGRRDDRPELARVIDLATAGGLDALVIPKLDRLGRSTRHLLATIERLEAAGARLVSLKDHIDTSTPSGRLLLRMLASVAEFESDMISERVASVTTAKAVQGRAHGRAPYGYRSAGKDGLLVVEHEAAIVRRIFTAYAVDGRSQRQIARDLNGDGIKAQRDGEWTQGTISKLLSTPVAAGFVRVNGKTYDGTHKPIISRDLWQKAEQLRQATARSNGGKGRTPSANHALSGGMLRCGRCGSSMTSTTKPTRTPGKLYEVYRCSGRAAHGLDYCSQMPVQREPIDRAVFEFFTNVALDLDATKHAITVTHDAKLAELAVLHQHADRDAHRAQERLARVRRDYQDGKLDADDWASFRDELTDELAAARAQVDRLDSQRQAISADREQFDTESAVLQELTALRAIVVGEARAGSRQSVDAFRVALRRLFASFDLLDWRQGELDDLPDDPADVYSISHPDLRLGPTVVLRPRVREDAITAWADGEAFPALKKAALALRASDENTLQT